MAKNWGYTIVEIKDFEFMTSSNKKQFLIKTLADKGIDWKNLQ